MGGAAVIDYLLTDFMQTTLERYDERWWRDYAEPVAVERE
jgi:hypothetical protein